MGFINEAYNHFIFFYNLISLNFNPFFIISNFFMNY